jgi:hypothetical protein
MRKLTANIFIVSLFSLSPIAAMAINPAKAEAVCWTCDWLGNPCNCKTTAGDGAASCLNNANCGHGQCLRFGTCFS